MTKNYHQPFTVSSLRLVLVAAIALGGMTAVELLQTGERSTNRTEKLAAASLAREAMDAIKQERQSRNLPIDLASDPVNSGLIGAAMTSVTSNTGILAAKQTAVNPNFAAAIVDMLLEAGVKEGDTVAVGFSGSFPSLNLCACAAIETMDLKPVIISSASASQWGANHPELLWIDMERALQQRGIVRYGSVAASLGGLDDRASGMSTEGQQLLKEAIRRNKLAQIDPVDLSDSINQRMVLYRKHAGGRPIAAYINVGGGTTSVGTHEGKDAFSPGLNLHAPAAIPTDSVMARFTQDGVPIVHLVNIEKLATRYGLPVQPTVMPPIGDGGVYSPRAYNRWLAGGVLVVIVASLCTVAWQGNTARAILSQHKEPRDEADANST